MQEWQCNFKTATNVGISCNCPPKEDEFQRSIDKTLCAWFNVYPERYQWNGTWIEEIPGYMEAKEKEAAFNKRSSELLEERKNRNNVWPFIVGENTYVNDEQNIQGVKVQILDKPLTDPLPTFIGLPVAGCWKTFDDQFVPFTNQEFMDTICETYFAMRSFNFGWYGVLVMQLAELYSSPTSTKEQIAAFEITVGWHPASVTPYSE